VGRRDQLEKEHRGARNIKGQEKNRLGLKTDLLPLTKNATWRSRRGLGLVKKRKGRGTSWVERGASLRKAVWKGNVCRMVTPMKRVALTVCFETVIRGMTGWDDRPPHVHKLEGVGGWDRDSQNAKRNRPSGQEEGHWEGTGRNGGVALSTKKGKHEVKLKGLGGVAGKNEGREPSQVGAISWWNRDVQLERAALRGGERSCGKAQGPESGALV